MVLHFKILCPICALFVAGSSGAVLRGQPSEQDLQNDIASTDSEIQKLQAQLDGAMAKSAAPPPAAPVPVAKLAKVELPAKPQTETEKLDALSKGLKTIHNLRAIFKKDRTDGPHRGAEKFANGAMSEELSDQNSQVWSTIESMLGTVQQVTGSMKGKSKSEQKKIMDSLEGQLDKKANVLSTVTDNVSKKQQEQDEQYLLGLLLLHRNNWSMEKQLNATETFMRNSPVLRDLFKHHDATKPLADQLAARMDAEPANKASKVAAKKQAVAKKATALFIQLANTIMDRDCPYCAAQCVDKCHTAGKPYVQCLTDCADAGK